MLGPIVGYSANWCSVGGPKACSRLRVDSPQTELEAHPQRCLDGGRNGHGAAGTQALTVGEEVRHIPYKAIVAFYKLTQHWEATGIVPRQLQAGEYS